MIVDLVGLAIVCMVALFVAYPLLVARRGPPVPNREAELDLLRQRDTLYREIADLDFDRRTGKVGEEDYREQREEYLEEAATVLQRLDEQPAAASPQLAPAPSSFDDEIEREVRRLRARTRRR
jgi:hypothetical protein